MPMISVSVRRGLIVVLLAFLAWQWLGQRAPMPPSVPRSSIVATAASGNAELPPEAQATLRLIANNGPFPYQRDGIVFGNYEHRLPEHERGYYHEYTVPTPGAHDRGARRIIVGGDPPIVYYYSDDHYQTFRQIGAPR